MQEEESRREIAVREAIERAKSEAAKDKHARLLRHAAEARRDEVDDGVEDASLLLQEHQTRRETVNISI